ncbi:MAG TPA: MBL fold metallo-hydrolase, partial [Candidatus Binatia bacterium]|nr:MBL fold metallo-hydrolase [Candidatus Binatia bacterium]
MRNDSPRGGILTRPLALAFLVVMTLACRPAAAQQEVQALAATDGYFEVRRIDDVTFAISEPQYWQKNIAYVLKGEKRAILFDTGSGKRDIKFIAGNVTRKPMTAVASHLHYDHIGSHASFDHVAMADLPELRERIAENRYHPEISSSLFPMLDSFYVTEWWRPGQVIDIGGRTVEVMHIPGHSPDSIALIDRARGQAFVGDHLYPGELYAFLPGSDLLAYRESTRRLLEIPEIRTVLCAHMEPQMPRDALV